MVADFKEYLLMSPEEYLNWEAKQELRYEYVDGEIRAMTGGSIPHNDIALNLYSELRPHSRKLGCMVNVSDVKVRGNQNNRYFYPDLVISCNTIAKFPACKNTF